MKKFVDILSVAYLFVATICLFLVYIQYVVLAIDLPNRQHETIVQGLMAVAFGVVVCGGMCLRIYVDSKEE